MDEPIFTLDLKKKKKGKRICKDELCEIEGTFGYNKDNLFCKRHKKDDMEDVKNKKCEKKVVKQHQFIIIKKKQKVDFVMIIN